jgi:dihydroxyacetone kinase
MGVALSPCTVPAAGRPTFSLGDDEMEIGMGVHGEPGRHRGPLETADAVAERLTRAALEDLPFRRGDRVAVLVNGLGATPFMELYILFRKVAAILDQEGIALHRCWVGEYVTSLEMAGASVSLLQLDDELQRLLDAAATMPFYTPPA